MREEWENALSAHPDADDVSSLEERCASFGPYIIISHNLQYNGIHKC